MVGVALLTGLRRGELFALRWKAVDLDCGTLQVQEAVYEGTFGTPKTAAGLRSVPLPARRGHAACDRGENGSAGASRTTWCSRRSGQADFAEQRPAALGVSGL